MSAAQERRLDNLYKLFMVIMMSFCGFFLMRLVSTLDKTVEKVQNIEVKQAVMEDNITAIFNRLK